MHAQRVSNLNSLAQKPSFLTVAAPSTRGKSTSVKSIDGWCPNSSKLSLRASSLYVMSMLLLYYKASFTWSKLLICIDKLVLQYVFTRQGSQVRTLYHPPVISQLNQALTRNRSAFFTSKSSINTPYYYSYVSALVLLGFAGDDAGCNVSVVNGADKLIASEKKRSSHSERDLEQLLV